MTRYVITHSIAVCALLALCAATCAWAQPTVSSCQPYIDVETGRACGVLRASANGTQYRSFRGIPYAKQPLGELRFKELEPPEPWDRLFYALHEGPICPQDDTLYKDMMQPQGMSDACIHANVHIPDEAFVESESSEGGLPILVMIHGGGFAYGSGDADVYGPELLVSKGVIVVTFNYRLNVFGFLSLGSASIPGNQGLRDMVTLLKWVRRNAKAFGGNPDDVTLMGQSAGAAAAHLLSLSPAAEGLLKRAIIMSGTAIPTFYALTPNYAGYIANLFLSKTLETPTNDPEEIHRQLIDMPLEKIVQANKELQAMMGITAFFPVIEADIPGVTRIIDDDTEKMLKTGRGKDIPLLIGYTNVECETFREAFENYSLIERIKQNNVSMLPLNVVFENIFHPKVLQPMVEKVAKVYFNGNITLDRYVEMCTQSYFEYPALKVAQYRREQSDAAPAFLYQFSYEPQHSVLKKAWGFKYSGAAHVEDMTFVFQVNSVSVEKSAKDDEMKRVMNDYVVNFIRCNDPKPGPGCSAGSWPPVSKQQYEVISSPSECHGQAVSPAQRRLLALFDSLRQDR